MKKLIALLALLAACGSEADYGYEDETYTVTESDLGDWEEARTYLGEDDNGVWAEGLSVEDLESLVDSCYDAGAPRVMFADIVDLGGSDVSAWLVVEMPAADPEREAVLVAFNEVASPYGQPARDEGQAFLDLAMD